MFLQIINSVKDHRSNFYLKLLYPNMAILSQIIRFIHGLLDPKEHGGVPGVQSADTVILLYCFCVPLHILVLYLGNQSFKDLSLAGIQQLVRT